MPSLRYRWCSRRNDCESNGTMTQLHNPGIGWVWNEASAAEIIFMEVRE